MKHEQNCIIYVCTCENKPMTKTYTYSFRVEPEIEQMLGGYLKQFEDIGYQKAKAEIDRLKAENAKLREALEYYADKAWVNIKMPYLIEVDYDDVSKPFPDQKPMGGRRAREALKGSK